MARADLLVSLVRSGAIGDQHAFRRAAEALIAEESGKQHAILARQLSEALDAKARPSRALNGATTSNERAASDLYLESEPDRYLTDLVLPELVRETCSEVIEEHHRQDLLRSYGLEPRHRILLVGPPGSGKTSLAEALATSLMIPLLSVRYESLIGSFLGETAARLDALFDLARKQPCVLFFDEFDAIAKERGDSHETGEIKRVVSSLLLQMDRLPSYVVVIAATNHHELLDRAVWRRMQLRLELPHPSRATMIEWLDRYEQRTGRELSLAPRTIADRLHGASFAELEEVITDVERRTILAGPSADSKTIMSSRLTQWSKRARPSAS